MATLLESSQAKQFIEENKTCQILDVRNPDEFNAGHIKGAKLIPLSELEAKHAELSKDKHLLVYCKSGKRSNKAVESLEQKGYKNLFQIAGGLDAWLQAGHSVNKLQSCPISVSRQVFIVAGTLILASSLLTFINRNFIAIPIFVGAGLLFSGLTGFCGMQILLEKMPWNKAK